MTTPDQPCCDLGASGVTRRGLFRAAAATGGVMTFGSAYVATASATPGLSASSIIVVLSLRGAADGLSLVVPHSDRTYYKARPTIAVPKGALLAKDNTVADAESGPAYDSVGSHDASPEVASLPA